MKRQGKSRSIGTAETLDTAAIRRDFPILGLTVHGKPLVYLDNASTTQKPASVIAALTKFYESQNSNVHRGVHFLSDEATRCYEDAREQVRRFINARDVEEIVFVRGTTEAVNLVCASWGRKHVAAGDEVIISAMEHHSNIVPWQMLCAERGAELRVIPMDDRGDLILEEFGRMLTPRTRIVAVNHVSNALGTVNPVGEIVKIAHGHGVPVLLDGAQAVPHMAVDVMETGCDFFAFSGHKIYGPMGIGVLYGRMELFEAMSPWQGGGDMIKSVTFDKTVYNDPPYLFEAGTPNVAGAVGLSGAIAYLSGLGLDAVAHHEAGLLSLAARLLSEIPGVRLIGTAREKAGVISFTMDDVHPHDIGTILDGEGIAIRTGHHCAQPVMDRFGVPATVRASFGVYNTAEEVEALAAGVKKVKGVFG